VQLAIQALAAAGSRRLDHSACHKALNQAIAACGRATVVGLYPSLTL
jgi:hypothetical protein